MQQARQEASSRVKVLFLCTGNSARSQMGEALLRVHGGDIFDVYSAGLEPKGLNPYTLRVMAEKQIDMSRHWSKDVREYLGKVNFGYLITVCGHAEENCPAIFPGVSYRLHWPFDDPAAAMGGDDEILAKFRTVRDEIETKVREWVAEQRAA